MKGVTLRGRPLYLDMQATTPLDPRVLDAMLLFSPSGTGIRTRERTCTDGRPRMRSKGRGGVGGAHRGESEGDRVHERGDGVE